MEGLSHYNLPRTRESSKNNKRRMNEKIFYFASSVY